MKDAIYMIESDPALSLVKGHIAEVLRVRKENQKLADEIGGVESWRVDRMTGEIVSVNFENGKHHPEFKKPTKWGSSPKKGTEWAKRFGDQKAHKSQESLIANTFDVPYTLGYTTEDGGEGWRRLGAMLNACGFLYLSKDGPYALWIPDVAKEVAEEEARGSTVDARAKNFNMELPGCRRIEKEEWDILVAQDSLAKKRAAQQTA